MLDEQVQVQFNVGRRGFIQLLQEICRESGCRNGIVAALADDNILQSGTSGLYHCLPLRIREA